MSDLVEQMKRAALMLPIRVQNGQDYAEAFGQDFQAMTMTPDRFEALNALPQWIDRIAALEAENDRLRHAHTAIVDNWIANRVEEGDEFSEGFDDGLRDAALVAKDALGEGDEDA